MTSLFAEIHSKDLVAVLHLLVSLARFFRAPIRLPDHVAVPVIVVTVRDTCAVVLLFVQLTLICVS